MQDPKPAFDARKELCFSQDGNGITVNCSLGLLITVLDEAENKVFLFVSEVCGFSLEQLPPQQAWKQASLASHGGRTAGGICSGGVVGREL